MPKASSKEQKDLTPVCLRVWVEGPEDTIHVCDLAAGHKEELHHCHCGNVTDASL